MAENLKATRYRNGDAIPNVTNGTAWAALTTGAYCNYDNSTSNASIYGHLYNWHLVTDGRNIAPADWHVPSDAEWKTLEKFLGISQSDADLADAPRGTYEGGKLKETGTTHWISPNTGAVNTSGFSALPGGYCGNAGAFHNPGYSAIFWSSSENSNGLAWYRYLGHNLSEIGRGSFSKHYGYSIRCVRD